MSDKSINISKEVPVVGNYDVVICGGGPSGFIAAIAAAREGARTALIERYGFLGGMATAAYVTPMSVFSYNGQRIVGGIPWEFVKRLEGMNGALIEQPLNNVAFDPELYKLCAQDMLDEAHVVCYMNSYLTDVVCADQIISHLVFENKNGAEAVSARIVIDATGDADVCHKVQAPMQPEEDVPRQPASLCFILSGVDTTSEMMKCMHHNTQGKNCHCLPVREKLLELQKKMKVPNFGGPWFCTVLHPGTVAVNATRTMTDVCDNRDFSGAEKRLRKDVYVLTGILKEYIPEFRNCWVASVGVQAGPRESRRILGVHTITGEEYFSAYEYEDSIARGAHPIDIHRDRDTNQDIHFLEKAAFVPYRSLYMRDYPNLLVSGRCISADKRAFAAIRVQATAMGIGQAAGVAAAMASENNCSVQDVNSELLRMRLKEHGAVI